MTTLLLAGIDADRAAGMVTNTAAILAALFIIAGVLAFFSSISDATKAVQRMEKEQARTNQLLARIADANEAVQQEQVAARVRATRTSAPFKAGAVGVQPAGSGDAGA